MVVTLLNQVDMAVDNGPIRNQNTDSPKLPRAPSIDSKLDFPPDIQNRRDSALRTLRHFVQSEVEQLGGRIYEAEFIQLFSQKHVLDNIFHLFDWSAAGVIRLDLFLRLLRSKVKTKEEHSLVDDLESAVYDGVSNGNITQESFETIFSLQIVLSKLFKLISGEDNSATVDWVMSFVTDLTNVRRNEELSELDLQRVESIFRRHMRSDHHIYLDDFRGLVKAKNPFFVNRVFHIFDADGSGGISWPEFKRSVQLYCGSSVSDKIYLIFLIYDLDGDGRITQDELKLVLEASGMENGLQLSDSTLNDLSRTLFQHINREISVGITFEQLERFLETHEDLESICTNIDRWLLPVISKNKEKRITLYDRFVNYVANSWSYVMFLIFFFGMNTGLFVQRAVEIWHQQQSNNETLDRAIFIVLARGSGRALCFNSILVLVMMFRISITFLRVRGFASFLPLDKHVFLHKLCGITILFFGFVHTVAHVFNFCMIVSEDSSMCLDLLFTMDDYGNNFGLIFGFASISGWVLVVILTVMSLASLPIVRRKGYFEVFYWTHLLYIPFWIFEILHCPNFWKWFVAPGAIFVIELLVRFYRKWTARGKTTVESAVALPSDVTHLVIKRPKSFHFHSGDFVFVNVPMITSYEWHPFAISSAPEDSDILSLHIRAVGDWTRKLHELGENWQSTFSVRRFLPRINILSGAVQSRSEFKDGNPDHLSRTTPYHSSFTIDATTLSGGFPKWGSMQTFDPPRPMKVIIDGPYGAPSGHVFRAQHAVLIATGIGVTPFVSVLQSIIHRYQTRCPECHCSWISGTPQIKKLRKVDFIWINRDSRNVSWFYDVLSRLESQQTETQRFLDIHIYITSMQQRADVKSVGLQSALDLLYQRNQRDEITGLKTRTRPGRPNWDEVFQTLKMQNKGKITVFYCGIRKLSSLLAKKCTDHDLQFRKDMY